MPEQPANLIWGDNDYRTLYITATTSVYKLRTKVRGFVPYLAKPQQKETQKQKTSKLIAEYAANPATAWDGCEQRSATSAPSLDIALRHLVSDHVAQSAVR